MNVYKTYIRRKIQNEMLSRGAISPVQTSYFLSLVARYHVSVNFLFKNDMYQTMHLFNIIRAIDIDEYDQAASMRRLTKVTAGHYVT